MSPGTACTGHSALCSQVSFGGRHGSAVDAAAQHRQTHICADGASAFESSSTSPASVPSAASSCSTTLLWLYCGVLVVSAPSSTGLHRLFVAVRRLRRSTAHSTAPRCDGSLRSQGHRRQPGRLSKYAQSKAYVSVEPRGDRDGLVDVQRLNRTFRFGSVYAPQGCTAL